MTSFGPWLKPTLLGPLLTVWVLTTLGSVLVGMSALTGGRLDSWLLGMLFGSFFASGLSVMLIVVDVLLLRAKLRQLPTGARAWIGSLLAPLAVSFLISLPFIPPPESVLGLVVLLFGAMSGASFGVRMLFGTRPSA